MINVELIDGAPGSHFTAGIDKWIPAFNEYAKLVQDAWGLNSITVDYAKNVKKANRKSWWIVVGLYSDQQGALGYHDIHPSGLPFSRVFAADDFNAGVSLSVTITHELAEMVVDPEIDRSFTQGPREYLVEVGDPVEDDLYGFDIQGVKCSDFVLPSYYGGEGPFDYGNRLVSPCPSLLSGGYISWQENGIWHQTTARHATGNLSYRSQRYGRSARAAAKWR